MSYPFRYTVTVIGASSEEYNLISKEMNSYYKEVFPNNNIEVVEKEQCVLFESVGDEVFIGFENCPAEKLSKNHPTIDFEWRRLYAGDYSAVEATYKNGEIIKEEFFEPDFSMYED